MKLDYKATFKVSNWEMGDFADSPEIIYELWANRPIGWREKCLEFIEGKYESIDLALDIVGMILVSVSQDDETWPIKGRDGAQELRDSVEEQNPGYGDTFIFTLAVALFNHYYEYAEQRSKNSSKPSRRSGGGKKAQSKNGATKRSQPALQAEPS